MKNKRKIVAIQMDPLSKVKYATDSSILLGLELQRRGYEIFCYTPKDLSLINNQIIASGYFIRLQDKPEDFYQVVKDAQVDLATVILVLVRQDPPFNMEYITSTYLLDRITKLTLVLNNPAAIRNHPEKFSVYDFPELIPPSVVSYDKKVLKDFLFKYSEVVIKPLFSFAGDAVKLITKKDDYEKIFDHYIHTFQQIVLQKFLPGIKDGDKRVIMVDGEVMGVMSRIPEPGGILANVAAGGRVVVAELSEKEKKICSTLRPVLKANGLFIAGVDIIEEYLIEINVTSPTSLKQLNFLYSNNIEKQIVDKLEKQIEAFHKTSIYPPSFPLDL